MIVKKSSGQVFEHCLMSAREQLFAGRGFAIDGDAPEWVHLLQNDANETDDGRGPFVARDMAKIIEVSLARSVDKKLPIDVNHSINVAAPQGQPSPAVGWIVELAARANGLWGKVEWTPQGKQLLADRAYRFISPVLFALKDKTISFIARASLVNAPALHGLTPILNSSQTEKDDMIKLATLLAALGLAENVEESVALAAIDKLKTSGSVALASVAEAIGLAKDATAEVVLLTAKTLKDPAKFVPAEQVTLLRTELSDLTKSIAKGKAETFIDAAIAAGKPGIKPLRDHYVARHMADPAAVEKELGAMVSFTTKTVMPVKTEQGDVAMTEADTQACTLLGLDPKAYAKTKQSLGNMETV